MGTVRTFSRHIKWTEKEILIIRDYYATATHSYLLLALPGRSISQIQNKANGLGIIRYRKPKMTSDEIRKAKREHMARRWREKPEVMREYARQNHAKNKDKRNERLRITHSRRLFWSRATKLKGINAKDLASLWKQQRGLCALTGQKLAKCPNNSGAAIKYFCGICWGKIKNPD